MTDTRRIPAFCTQCRSRCGCEALVKDGRLLGIAPLPGHPSGDKLCPKGRAASELVYHPDRLTRPLRRTSPKGTAKPTFEAISWDEALDTIAGEMTRIRAAHGPEGVAFSVTTPSGTHMSDGLSLVERFIRAFGSPNTIYSTEICNWHKDVATRFTYGTDIGTPDFANTDCIVLWGHNPAATWLARSTEVFQARRRGAKLVVIDPRPTLYARRADCWLQVNPGTDQAVALGLINLIVAAGRFDIAFAREWTNGAFLVRADSGRFLRESDVRKGGADNILLAATDDGTLLRYDTIARRWLDDADGACLAGAVEIATPAGALRCHSALSLLAEVAAEWPPERVAKVAGVGAEDLARAADILVESASVAYYAWNGIGQSVTATATDRAISILYSLLGHYGAKGGNVPGAAAAFADISGLDLVADDTRARTLGLAERPLGPGRNGWVTARDVYRAILKNDPYPIRMLFSFGGNLLAAQPDTEKAVQALAALDFHVHTDFFLNESARHADIVLPVATSWEREGLRTGFDASLEGMRRVQLRPAVIAPVGEARSDIDIAMALAERLGFCEKMFDGDADKAHAATLAPSGIALETLRAHPEGITVDGHVPLKAYRKTGFATPSGRIEIYSETFLQNGYPPLPRFDATDMPVPDPARPLRLGGAKTIAFCHSQHRNILSLRKLAPDPIAEMAPETAAERGIAEADWVEISTAQGAFLARAKVDKGLAPGAVFTQHGWTIGDATDGAPAESGLSANMNSAVSTERADPISGSIPLRASWCEVRKA